MILNKFFMWDYDRKLLVEFFDQKTWATFKRNVMQGRIVGVTGISYNDVE